MGMHLKLTTVGNSVGVILPGELLEKLRVGKGDTLHVLETPNGIELTPFNPEFARQMEVADLRVSPNSPTGFAPTRKRPDRRRPRLSSRRSGSPMRRCMRARRFWSAGRNRVNESFLSPPHVVSPGIGRRSLG